MAARKKKTASRKRGKSEVAVRGSSALGAVGAVGGDLAERFKKYVERDSATAGGVSGWPYIGTSNGIFNLGEDDNREVLEDVIILGAMYENAYYEGDYDPSKRDAPLCFALAETEEKLSPPESLGDARQSMQSDPAGPDCGDCWANQFGTAERGKGKACKNVRRLALLPGDELTPKFLTKVDGAMLRLPVTSVKAYSQFVNKVTKALGVPLFMMRVNITITPDRGTQFKIDFDPADWIETERGEVPAIITDPNVLEVLEERVKEAEGHLSRLPTQGGGDDESGPKRDRKAVAARAGGRATPTRKKKGTRSSSGKKTTKKKAGRKTAARSKTSGERKF